MATVTMPDGAVVDMPDQLDPALGARLRAFQQNYKPPAAAPEKPGIASPGTPLAHAGAIGENAISGITAGLGSLVDALTGAAPGTHNFAYVPRTPEGKALAALLGKAGGAATNAVATGVGKVVGAAGGNEEAATQTAQERIPEALGAVGTVAAIPEALEAGGGAASALRGAPPTPMATETGIGLQSAGDSPFLAGAAGPSGLQVLSDANRAKATTALGARAGVPHGTDVNLDNLETGRAPADAVGQRAAAALPTGPINGDGATQIENAGPSTNIVTRSDAAQATIDTQKHRLLNSTFSGDDVMANLRSLRKQGYARMASENPEDWDIGHAQLDMARGLETHIDEQLNASNANVSMDQIREARVTQAQNSALQAAMKGSNIDFAALARMSRADPDKFTGVFKEVADFANDHPKVMQLPAEIPPSFRNDLGNAVRSAGLPQDVAGRIFGALGVPAGARRLLTGGAPDLTAAQRTPVAGLGGEFDPIARTTGPQPPPGNLSAGPMGAPSSAASAVPGSISLADFLSHGVEQRPAPGLSVAPMGAPAPSGMPFAPNLEHAAGGLTLAPEAPRAAPTNLSDLANVMSQGVPEGIVQRSKPGGLTMPVAHGPAFPTGNTGIVAEPIKLGNLNPKQRGAVGEPVNIGPLRALQNEPRTYAGESPADESTRLAQNAGLPDMQRMKGSEVGALRKSPDPKIKAAAEAELARRLKALPDTPRTYAGGGPLGDEF